MYGAVRRLCAHLDPLQPALADRGVSYGHTLLAVAEHIRCVRAGGRDPSSRSPARSLVCVCEAT